MIGRTAVCWRGRGKMSEKKGDLDAEQREWYQRGKSEGNQVANLFCIVGLIIGTLIGFTIFGVIYGL